VSKRAPTPYSTAATCLHIDATSGHEHENSISFGAGNSPCSRCTSSCMTPFESRPCSSSTSEPTWPEHFATSFFQRGSWSGEIVTRTS
jgi:hypothetical protein